MSINIGLDDFLKLNERLGEKEKDILNFIQSYRESHAYAPSMMEICRKCGLRSTNTVYAYLQKLKNKGLIDWQPKVSRTIRIVKRSYVKRPPQLKF
ncbi:helix-turn-helix domain-containing protein [Heyndrickxia ginsengihumi]|uniref:LexA family protein n=1 Tax=Heyndrickxia ginsengihumi TaxID=363870 RepID=UPI0004727C52|nr:helix-turn-helix domain-containing protein [Heyndrickxia ginsengihumi]MCM3024772.1 helix-turn-helix domain-containing protein [Heyndrickxia ginsengihumi]